MTRTARILAALATLVVAALLVPVALLVSAGPASAAPPPGPVDIAQPETPPVPDPPAPDPGLDLAPCTQDCGPTVEPGPPLLPDGDLVADPCPTHGCGSDPVPVPGPGVETDRPAPGPVADPTLPADVLDVPLPTRIDAGDPPAPSPMTLTQTLLILAAAFLAVTSAAAAWMSRTAALRR